MNHYIILVKVNVEKIQQSKMREQDKVDAIQSLRRISKYSVFIVLLATAIAFLSFFFIPAYSVAIAFTVSLIAVLCIIFLLVRPSAYRKALTLIDNGWDGLSQVEINERKPNVEQQARIRTLKRYRLVYVLFVFLCPLVFVFAIQYFTITLPFWAVGSLFLMLLFFWLLKAMEKEEEIKQLESGRTK